MLLSKYIEKHGFNEIAHRVGVSKALVQYWRRCERAPSPMTANRLIKTSKGELTWKSVFSEYVKKKVGK